MDSLEGIKEAKSLPAIQILCLHLYDLLEGAKRMFRLMLSRRNEVIFLSMRTNFNGNVTAMIIGSWRVVPQDASAPLTARKYSTTV